MPLDRTNGQENLKSAFGGRDFPLLEPKRVVVESRVTKKCTEGSIMLPGLSNVLRRDKERQRSTLVPESIPSPSTSSRPAIHVMLPEEHRAKEKEKEKMARAQLGNAYTQQMMANRQLQQNMSPTRQQQMQTSSHGRVSKALMSSHLIGFSQAKNYFPIIFSHCQVFITAYGIFRH